MSVLGPRRNEHSVSHVETVGACLEFDLEGAVHDVTDVTLATPVRNHLLRVLDEPQNSRINAIELVTYPGSR